LELIKDQLFNPDKYTEFELKATRWTLYHVGLRILQMYAPYLPFVTENIYGTIYQKQTGVSSLHQTKYANVQQNYLFEESAALMETIIEIIAQVRKLKTEKQLSLKVPLASLTISCSDEHLLHKIEGHIPLLRGVTHAEKFVFNTQRSASEIQEIEATWHIRVRIGKE
jgi:valyl-tRNA synthetase